ncbi:hypothetical protein DCAR_0209728 [Daucus carota subsp. sativus]|uniref:Uncharacterized protein n=1 Tax=Daucus carota subsp. sativus TaxID=79200 RepID=A0A162AYS3_DAUCS|nr:hypothetical protein DCAR_0209728 [Daucus carota subsp. sativus]
MTGLFAPALKLEKSRAHVKFYISNSDRQIDGLDYPVTYSGLRDLVKRMRDSPAFWESRMFFGFMSNLIANAVVESDEKDPFTIIYLGRRVFKETPENEMQRQWWLANSEFREDDLDLIVRMADLFYPLDTFKLDDGYRVHTHLYFANSDD